MLAVVQSESGVWARTLSCVLCLNFISRLSIGERRSPRRDLQSTPSRMEGESPPEVEPSGGSGVQNPPFPQINSDSDVTVSLERELFTCQLLRRAALIIEAWSTAPVLPLKELHQEAKDFGDGGRKPAALIEDTLKGNLLDDVPPLMNNAVHRIIRNSYDGEVEKGWRGVTQEQQAKHERKRAAQCAFTSCLLTRQRDMHKLPRLSIALGIDRVVSSGTCREHDVMCQLRAMPSEAYIRNALEAMSLDWRPPHLKFEGDEPSKLYEVTP
jgi:hypothetical protein